MATVHYPHYSKEAGYKERVERVISCSCGWISPLDYDVRNKPLFAQHKRDAKVSR